jgi:hypothetical protein
MKCQRCNEAFNYPEDELVFLNSDGQDLFYQDAMDTGYAKVVCYDCLKASVESKPIHVHDCDFCTFLGNDQLYMNPVDMYVCSQSGSPTLIIRWGDKGGYTSWNFMFLEKTFPFEKELLSLSMQLARKYYEQAKKALEVNH